jgi:hypothetical protein
MTCRSDVENRHILSNNRYSTFPDNFLPLSNSRDSKILQGSLRHSSPSAIYIAHDAAAVFELPGGGFNPPVVCLTPQTRCPGIPWGGGGQFQPPRRC